MKSRKPVRLIALVVVVLVVITIGALLAFRAQQGDSRVLDGLRNPRSAVMLPDQAIVVTEAGLPDVAGTADKSTRQITNGRLSWFREDGNGRRTLLDRLPGQFIGLLNEVIGPSGIALAPNGGIYLLIGQCAQTRCSSLQLFNRDGQLTLVADLLLFAAGNPGVTDGGSPNEESNPWGIAVAIDGTIFVSDAAANSIIRIDPRTVPATISIHARLPEQAVPTGIAVTDDGTLFVAIFTALKHPIGSGTILQISPNGQMSSAVAGLTMPIGVLIEPDGKLLVLEFAASYAMDSGYRPQSGKLTRIDPRSPTERQVLSTGLNFPTSVMRTDDGAVYVTANGSFSGNAQSAGGELLRVGKMEWDWKRWLTLPLLE